MSLSLAARVLGVELDGTDRDFTTVAIDSRRLESGALFVALRGERFDGHDFVADAVAAGAAGVLGERDVAEDIPTIRVADSLDALQRLAADWRRRFECRLAAVTGSNGKTTVKEMIGAIVSRAAPSLVSAGNLNNHIGVPLSLLRLREGHRYAVIEMGMNHAGELSLLSRLAAPDVALVNNAAAAHLEGLGSVEGVARAKGEIFSALSDDGVAVINADDAFAGYWRGLNERRRCLTFGIDAEADVRGTVDVGADRCEIIVDFAGNRIETVLPVGGAHNARNAVAAAAVALALDVDADTIAAGLAAFRPVDGRSAVVMLADGTRLVDDTYNANPASMAAAIDLLGRFDGARVLVVGDMGELGADAAALHREVGERARHGGVNRLLGLGPLSAVAVEAFGEGGQSFDGIDELIEALQAESGPGVTVLVKGSRAMRMERVARALAGDDGGTR